MTEFTNTDELRGATFTTVDLAGSTFTTVDLTGTAFAVADLTDATFRDSDLRNVRIVSCVVDGLQIAGFDGNAGTVIVDDVDVSEFVRDQLDRRHPERVQLRAAKSADDYTGLWDALERLWAETTDRAKALPEAALATRVNGEWSFVETLRHLVFAIDTWVGGFALGQPKPFHPTALAPTDMRPSEVAELGIDVDARPSFAEALRHLTERWATFRELLATVTDADLEQDRTAVIAPSWGEETHTLDRCIRTVLHEHIEHRRYAERDLAVIAAAAD